MQLVQHDEVYSPHRQNTNAKQHTATDREEQKTKGKGKIKLGLKLTFLGGRKYHACASCTVWGAGVKQHDT